MKIETVNLFKGEEKIIVNAVDVGQWKKDGWHEEGSEPETKPKPKGKTTKPE